MYWRYFLSLPAWAISSLLCVIFSKQIAARASDDGWLPRWLWWFQTPGDSLDGSAGWKTKDRPYLVEDTAQKKLKNRAAWLRRNSAYAFCINVLGFQARPDDVLLVTGDPLVNNHRATFHGGTVRYVLFRNGKPVAFQIYTIKPWLFGRYFRGNFGWKLWSMPTTEKMQFTCSPSPFRKIPK
jgi:hypothetical protein